MDKSRRNYLKAAIGTMVGVGAIAVVKSCNRYMLPPKNKKKTRPYGIIDITKLKEGQRIIIEYEGLPVTVVKRSKKIIDILSRSNKQLLDPLSKEPQQPSDVDPIMRSYRDDIFVYINVCTHLGCVPQAVNDDKELSEIHKDMIGGSLCSCHGAKFDASGRVFKNGPALSNLVVPEYKFNTKTEIKITGILNGSVIHRGYIYEK